MADSASKAQQTHPNSPDQTGRGCTLIGALPKNGRLGSRGTDQVEDFAFLGMAAELLLGIDQLAIEDHLEPAA